MEGLFWLVVVAGVSLCFIFCCMLGEALCLWFGSSSNHCQLALSACLSFFWLVVYVFSARLLPFCLWTYWFSSLHIFWSAIYTYILIKKKILFYLFEWLTSDFFYYYLSVFHHMILLNINMIGIN
jgi:hypothetical protein